MIRCSSLPSYFSEVVFHELGYFFNRKSYERIMKAKVALRKEIELLKVSDRKPSENGNKMLFDLVGDLYDLVIFARKNNNNPIMIKNNNILQIFLKIKDLH